VRILWIITLGIIIGILSNLLVSETDLGKFGSILVCIIGAITGYFTIDSLGLTQKAGTWGILLTTALFSLLFLYIMRKISKSF
jgi:uncharacterized membrane protein YeaQ/YmgE (transglycosylase-associated protein family)